MDSGLYWWRDRNKPLDGWTVVYVYDEGRGLRYKFIGIERGFQLNELGSGEFGARLLPPKGT
jgi:hypothetical protein